MRPGGVLWLLRHELRLTWRRLWAAGRVGRIGRIFLWATLGLTLAGASVGVALLVSALAPRPPLDSLAVMIAGAVMAMIGTLMLSQSIMAIVEVIYVRNDLDLLLASPIEPWTVMIVRTSAVALSSALFFLILFGAPALCIAAFGAPAWLAILPATGALALFATALALLLVIVLFRSIGPRQTRVIAQVLGALIGAIFFLASQAYNMAGHSRGEFGRTIMHVLQTTRLDTSGLAWIPARAALADWTALAIWVGFAVLCFLAAAWIFSAGFVADAAAAAGMGRGRRRARPGARVLRGGLLQAVLRKEWRLLRRDPLLLSQIGLQIVYFLPVGIVLWTHVGQGERSAALHALFSGSLATLSGLLTGGLIWITVSAEDAPELIAAAPVAKKMIDRFKLIAAVAPVGALLVLPLIAIGIDSPLDALWVAAACLSAAVSSGLIGIWYQKPANRKDFRRRRGASVTANLGQVFIATCWGGAAALAVSGLAPVALIPALIAVGLVLAMSESGPAPG